MLYTNRRILFIMFLFIFFGIKNRKLSITAKSCILDVARFLDLPKVTALTRIITA